MMGRKPESRMTHQEALAMRTSPFDSGNQRAPAIRALPGHAHQRIGAIVTLNHERFGAARDIEQAHLKGGSQHPGCVLMSAG